MWLICFLLFWREKKRQRNAEQSGLSEYNYSFVTSLFCIIDKPKGMDIVVIKDQQRELIVCECIVKMYLHQTCRPT